MSNYIENDDKLSEKSKDNNQIEWVKLMNNYRNMTEEIILKELILKKPSIKIMVQAHIVILKLRIQKTIIKTKRYVMLVQ